jgi:hypothetical protein
MTQKRITSKDLEIAFLINNTDGVVELIADMDKKPGKKVFLQAIDSLEDKGLETNELSAYVDGLFPSSGKGRGKQQPVDGEKRTYSVQVVKNSAPFIRLPLSILGAVRGEEVTVTFGAKSIKVSL